MPPFDPTALGLQRMTRRNPGPVAAPALIIGVNTVRLTADSCRALGAPAKVVLWYSAERIAVAPVTPGRADPDAFSVQVRTKGFGGSGTTRRLQEAGWPTGCYPVRIHDGILLVERGA